MGGDRRLREEYVETSPQAGQEEFDETVRAIFFRIFSDGINFLNSISGDPKWKK